MNPPTVIFQKVENRLISFFFYFIHRLNIICFVEKKNKNIFEVLFVYF